MPFRILQGNRFVMEKDSGGASLWWGEAPERPDTVGSAFRIDLQFRGRGPTACRAVGMRLGRFEASQAKWRDETGSAVNHVRPFGSLAPPLTSAAVPPITNHHLPITRPFSWLLSVLWSQNNAALHP
jgi:hypothetical protein